MIGMRRIQIHIDEALDAAVTAEAARRGMSKAALIRACIAREVRVTPPPPDDPWDAMIGWLDDEPVDDIDDVLYGPKA
jgi:Ribbon-helix-helix protein, copG family